MPEFPESGRRRHRRAGTYWAGRHSGFCVYFTGWDLSIYFKNLKICKETVVRSEKKLYNEGEQMNQTTKQLDTVNQSFYHVNREHKDGVFCHPNMPMRKLLEKFFERLEK